MKKIGFAMFAMCLVALATGFLFSDDSYATRVHFANGGSQLVVESGGSVLLHGASIEAAKGACYFVDSTVTTSGAGTTWAGAYKTISEANTAAAAGDSIFLKGSFTEAIVCAKIGVRFIGAGTGPHETTWTAAADAVCLTLSASDCLVTNIRFQPPAYTAGTPAAIVLNNASYTRIVRNRFQGKTGSYYAIFCNLDATHSSDNVRIERNQFVYLNNITTVNGSAIVSTATDGGFSCSSWEIVENDFDAPVIGININSRGCLLQGNHFRINGLKADATMGAVCTLAIDLAGTGSADNSVHGNYLGGAYTSSLYKVAAAGDDWAGNYNIAGLSAANP